MNTARMKIAIYKWPKEFKRYRRKRPKVDPSIFDSVLSHTRRSSASEKREKKIACPLLDFFASWQVSSPRLYRLSGRKSLKYFYKSPKLKRNRPNFSTQLQIWQEWVINLQFCSDHVQKLCIFFAWYLNPLKFISQKWTSLSQPRDGEFVGQGDFKRVFLSCPTVEGCCRIREKRAPQSSSPCFAKIDIFGDFICFIINNYAQVRKNIIKKAGSNLTLKS